MSRILTTLHLSDIQKEVLAKVKAAPNPQLAWEEISDAASNVDQNLAAARDVLGNLGLLMVGDGVLEVTEKGEEVMKDSNLLDDMGELTDDAQQFINKREPQQPPAPAGDEMDMGMGGEEDLGLPMESFSLFKSIHEDATALEHMRLIESQSPVTPEIMKQVLTDTALFLRGDKEWYDMAQVSQNVLYDTFSHEMPYGTQTGDDDTPDNWIWELGDREGADAVISVVRKELEKKAARQEKVWLR